MFGDGMVSLGTAVVTWSRRKMKASAKIVSTMRSLPSIRIEAGVNSISPGRVAELHGQVAGGLGHAAEGVDEVHVPGGAAELAVGGRLEADLLLHRDRAGDLLVLDRRQVSRGDPARGEVVTGLQQPLGAEQAADVVGAERGAGPAGHGYLS